MHKFLLTVTFCLLCSSSFSQAPFWEWQNPKPQGSRLKDVVMLDSSTYIAIGEAGLVIKTTDDGFTWNFKNLPITSMRTLNAIAFSADKMHGITITDDGNIFATTDQGNTWSKTPKLVSASLKDACYSSELEVFVVGLNGTILYSSDGGLTWELAATELSDHYHGISFADPEHGVIAARQATFYVTAIGGKNWIRKDFPYGNHLYGVDLLDAQYAIAGGEGGGVFLSNDSLSTWQIQKLPIAYNVLGVARLTKDRAVACDNYYGIVTTTNGGTTWEYTYDDITHRDQLRALSFADAKYGVCIGYNGIVLRTNDGGSTWYSLTERIADSETLRGVHCFDKNTAVAVGSTIVRTINAGKNWTDLGSPTGRILRAVDFPDNITGYAVGDTGTVLKSTDRGVSWTVLQTPISSSLRAVNFLDVQNGIAVGGDREVAITSDGGGSWFVQKISFPYELYGAAYLSPSSIIIVGSYSNPLGLDEGIILHSSDQGKTWQERPRAGFVVLAVSFVDSLYGFIGGSPGIGSNDQPSAGWTSDGGRTWNVGSTPGISNAPILAISGADRKRATAVGRGVSIHTTDGGLTWEYVETNTRGNLFAVHHPALQTATAVGQKAMIFRLTTSDKPLAAVNPVASSRHDLVTSIYPNPAKTSTTLLLDIGSPCTLTLELLTIEGQPVRTLHHGPIASGEYHVDVSLENLASGRYILVAKGDAITEYHRLIIGK